MKRNGWLVCGLATVLLLGWVYAVAQDATDADAGEARRARRAARAGGGRDAGARPARRGAAGGLAAFDYAGIAAELKLTKEQTEKLTGLILNQQLLMRLQRVKLEDDQKTKIKPLCMAAAKDVLAAMDRRAKGKAIAALQEKVRSDVLTDEQREMSRRPAGRRRQAGGAGDAAGGGRRRRAQDQ